MAAYLNLIVMTEVGLSYDQLILSKLMPGSINRTMHQSPGDISCYEIQTTGKTLQNPRNLYTVLFASLPSALGFSKVTIGVIRRNLVTRIILCSGNN